MLIRVSDEHIAKGERDSACDCPVGLAVSEAIGERVLVSRDHLTRIINGRETCPLLDIKLPNKVSNFIERFDKGLSVEPFEADIPDLEKWRDDKPQPTPEDDSPENP